MIGRSHSVRRAGEGREARVPIAALVVASLAASAWAQPPPAPGQEAQPPAQGAPITVVISGFRHARGIVRVDVCTMTTFLKDGCPYSAAAPAQVPDTTVTVPDVPPGVYAVQAFQDVNNNGRVDRNRLGIPRESLAFSNNAPLGLSGPSFARASFTHGAEPQTLNLRLYRFGGPAQTPSAAGG
jgi:uncharacterized protein (DUF2141 family)